MLRLWQGNRAGKGCGGCGGGGCSCGCGDDGWQAVKVDLFARLWCGGTANESNSLRLVGQEPGELTVPSSVTQFLRAGVYDWETWGIDCHGERRVLGRGCLTICQSLETQCDPAKLTHAERMVKALREYIEGRLPSGLESFSVSGGSINKLTVAEAERLLTKYQGRVRRQRAKKTGACGEIIRHGMSNR